MKKSNGTVTKAAFAELVKPTMLSRPAVSRALESVVARPLRLFLSMAVKIEAGENGQSERSHASSFKNKKGLSRKLRT